MNFIVGNLIDDSLTKLYFLTSKVLEKTNSNTIVKCINDFLRVLRTEGGNEEKVLFMLSDAASYMVKVAKNLKLFYANLIYVTCAAHEIH